MTVYWLTGAIGAGKSTLGAALAASMKDTLFIDGDFYLSEVEELPFEERITLIKSRLVEKCYSLVHAGQSAVIAYPLSRKEAISLKNQIDDQGLIIIGIELSSQTGETRKYSDWQKQRQLQMIEYNGVGYADILLKHPTQYLHDSLTLLKSMI